MGTYTLGFENTALQVLMTSMVGLTGRTMAEHQSAIRSPNPGPSPSMVKRAGKSVYTWSRAPKPHTSPEQKQHQTFEKSWGSGQPLANRSGYGLPASWDHQPTWNCTPDQIFSPKAARPQIKKHNGEDHIFKIGWNPKSYGCLFSYGQLTTI